MQHLFHFCLSGYGFLEGITVKDGQVSARLRVLLLPDHEKNATEGRSAKLSWIRRIMNALSLYDRPNQDEVFLGCVVDDRELVSILQGLEKQRSAGCTVLLGFRAGYTQFGFHHAGQTVADPKHMVHLHGKLLGLQGWFKDGRWMNLTDHLQAASFLKMQPKHHQEQSYLKNNH